MTAIEGAAQRHWLPLTAQERVEYQRIYGGHSCDRPVCSMVVITRYEAALAAAEAERDQAQEITESWYRQYQATSEAWAAAEQRATRLATLEQQLRDWQDHLRRVHHTLCDFPFRTELPDDYKEEEPCVQS